MTIMSILVSVVFGALFYYFKKWERRVIDMTTSMFQEQIVLKCSETKAND